MVMTPTKTLCASGADLALCPRPGGCRRCLVLPDVVSKDGPSGPRHPVERQRELEGLGRGEAFGGPRVQQCRGHAQRLARRHPLQQRLALGVHHEREAAAVPQPQVLQPATLCTLAFDEGPNGLHKLIPYEHRPHRCLRTRPSAHVEPWRDYAVAVGWSSKPTQALRDAVTKLHMIAADQHGHAPHGRVAIGRAVGPEPTPGSRGHGLVPKQPGNQEVLRGGLTLVRGAQPAGAQVRAVGGHDDVLCIVQEAWKPHAPHKSTFVRDVLC
mmetsp:Transcript_104/g.332  ORF Transcript_104/g.332 Transcript_104/m.332 type:complete len:269 (-) Transcript_104:490-1296(-)